MRTDGAARFVEQYRRALAGEPVDVPEPHEPATGRWIAVTLALAPMLALAALPLTAVLAIFAGLLGELAGGAWIGVLALVAVVVALAAVVGRVALVDATGFREHGWHRWSPAVVVAGLTLTGAVEIASGSRAADQILLMWPFAIAWCVVFLVRCRTPWTPARRLLWAAAPATTALVLLLAVTGGLFSWRFERSADALTDVARLAIAGEPVDGSPAGYFEVVSRHRVPGCALGLRIDGWYATDDRRIAWCPGGAPTVPHTNHLVGDWYELGRR